MRHSSRRCTPVAGEAPFEEMSMDALIQLKEMQKKSWAPFVVYENHTCLASPVLVSFAGVRSGQTVLDVACGTGVLALAAAAVGAEATAVDFSAPLLEHARQNATVAGTKVDVKEADAESLPFPDASFDVVLSQFGHMFAPRPDVVTKEMLRVLRPGGTIAFATWPPGLFSAEMLRITAQFGMPLPPGVPSPVEWGIEDVIRKRLAGVEDLAFDRGVIAAPYVSRAHVRFLCERGVGPILGLIQMLEKSGEAEKLVGLRKALDEVAARFFDEKRNVLNMEYLMTRGRKPG